jgi:GT2 family glycosyltransferase
MLSTKVSVIVVNFNSGMFLKKCVDSIFASNGDIDIIVVDNCSKDDSLILLQSAYPNEQRLQVVKNTANLGFANACNAGTRRVSGKYFLYLNPDCVLESNAITEMCAVLESDHAVGMVGGRLTNRDGSEQGGGRRAIPTPWRSFVRAFGFSRFANRWPKLFFDFYLHKQPLPEQPIEVEAISGACMMVRREALDDVGLLDEGYFMHCEDLDWCMRFRQKGWKILFAPSARVMHYLGVCSKSRPIFVEWHKHKGMQRFYKKFFQYQYPGPFMWLVAIGVWFRFLLLVGVHAFKRIIKVFKSKHV